MSSVHLDMCPGQEIRDRISKKWPENSVLALFTIFPGNIETNIRVGDLGV